MPSPATVLLSLSAVVSVLLLYLATVDISTNLSPQGCRMSWMSPSYVLQDKFNDSWSPLSRRYSLWLYREVGWDAVQQERQYDSFPVLFIPGNAGSSRQVRSIASSATRQYYSSPLVVSPELGFRGLRPLDFYAVEFNEDLSAFHGSTLESQIAYTTQAVGYILSLYQPGTRIILMGHSMGGIVAASLLPSKNISAVINLSTPHTLPPARLDSRIIDRFARLQHTLKTDETPIVSICGGATDMMIPSETCILPETSEAVFRRTVFSSALEGSWTGVGHREMAWCHQVRWRVARAALEMEAGKTPKERGLLLDRWLRDGRTVPAVTTNEVFLALPDAPERVESGELLVKSPIEDKTYLLPLNQEGTQRLTILVSQGAIRGIFPHRPIPLQVSAFTCRKGDSKGCRPLSPNVLKLIPNPIPGKEFPVPGEGSDESEGVVLFEAEIQPAEEVDSIAVKLEGADGRGWIVARIGQPVLITSRVSTWGLLFGQKTIHLPVDSGSPVSISFPNLLVNAGLVYDLRPALQADLACFDTLFPPLIMQSSNTVETHYFPAMTSPNRRILLHSHLSAPFVDHSAHVMNLTIYSSGELQCRRNLKALDISIDIPASLGRCSSRYLNGIVSWGIGVVSIIIFLAWTKEDFGRPLPSLGTMLGEFTRVLLFYLLPASFLLSFAPLPKSLYLGNAGIAIFSPLAPLMLTTTSGLVVISWWILYSLLCVVGRAQNLLRTSRRPAEPDQGGNLVSFLTVCLAIFFLIPWQVAYLGCWVIFLFSCASRLGDATPGLSYTAVPMLDMSNRPPRPDLTNPSRDSEIKKENLHHRHMLLLLMTWTLPVVAPVLIVWARTLYTAGLTTPFDGDHNPVRVMPWLALTEFASNTSVPLFRKCRFETKVSLRWLLVAIAAVAALIGPLYPYLVVDAVNATACLLVVCRIGKRFYSRSTN